MACRPPLSCVDNYRNNPRHNAQARDRLAAHTVAKQSSETMFPSTQTAAGVEPVTPAEENEAEEKEAVAESKAETEAEAEAEVEVEVLCSVWFV